MSNIINFPAPQRKPYNDMDTVCHIARMRKSMGIRADIETIIQECKEIDKLIDSWYR